MTPAEYQNVAGALDNLAKRDAYPAHVRAILREGCDLLIAAADLAERVERVLALHQPNHWGRCAPCRSSQWVRPYVLAGDDLRCPTHRILTGEDE